jgi:hypothetical protein
MKRSPTQRQERFPQATDTGGAAPIAYFFKFSFLYSMNEVQQEYRTEHVFENPSRPGMAI